MNQTMQVEIQNEHHLSQRSDDRKDVLTIENRISGSSFNRLLVNYHVDTKSITMEHRFPHQWIVNLTQTVVKNNKIRIAYTSQLYGGNFHY